MRSTTRAFGLSRWSRVLSTALLLLLVMGRLPTVQAASACTTYPITNTPGDERSPQINGSYVVWEGHDGGDNEIYLYNLTTKVTTPLTDNSGNDFFPQISDTHVVWQGSSDGDNEVFLHNISTGQTIPITDNEDISDRDAQVNGNSVVFRSDDGSDSIIRLYDITTGNTTTVSNAEESTDNRDPQVYGNYVTWTGLDDDAPNDREIFLYNISTQNTTQVTDNGVNDIYPYLSDDYLSFRGNDGDFEIYYYTLSGSVPTPVTSNTSADDNPRISRNYIVWHGNDGNDEEIYLRNILTQQTTPLTNNNALDFEAQIRGNSVVYRSNVDGDSEIYLYDIATEQYAGPFSDNTAIDTDVQVFGTTVVWASQENGNFDIFLRICGELPVITDQPDSTTIITGETATLNVAATGDGTLTYQWYEGASGDETTPIASAVASSYTTPALTSTTDYWVKVTNDYGSENSTTATVTVLDATQLLVNGDFETDDNTDKVPDGWKVVNRTSDPIKCNAVKTVSYAGDCAFRFKGRVGENAKLKQIVDLSSLTIDAGDVLRISAYVKSGSTSAKAKLKLVVTYADSTLARRIVPISTTSGYQLFTDELEVTQPVTRVVFMLQNRSRGGNLFIDSASLLLIPGAETLIPLPPSAPMRQSN